MKQQTVYMLKHMAVYTGYGENRFTMSRGSFRYRMSRQWRHRMDIVRTTEREDGFSLLFSDPEDHSTLELDVLYPGDLYEIRMRNYTGRGNRFEIEMPSHAGEHFYGCGETYSEFDLKGQNVRIFVAEHQNTKRISKKLALNYAFGKDPDRKFPFAEYESYYAQPTVVSSGKYFIHADTKHYAEFDFSVAQKTVLRFQELPHLWIGEADNYDDLAVKLCGLLGHYGPLPDWIHDGVILAIQEGCEAVDARVKKALDAGVKVNGVWSQDWCGCRRTGFGYQVMWNWEADESLYPNLKEKIAEWKEQGIHFLGYINPFMAIEKDLYRHASDRGWCVKDHEGKDYPVTITTFPAAMIDFTNPQAYAWYKNLIKENLIGIGMSGWMADFGEYLPVDCVLYSGQDPEEMHNQWPAIWARMNREAIEECGKENEIFFFTRAGYTESVRNSAMMWTGDQHVDWSKDDGLPSVIPATLSLAMSGQTVTHSDAGGYTTVMNMTRGKELLMRWMEMNTFSPLFRMHEGNQPSRNVQFDADEEILEHLAKMSRIHTALKPYLKKLEEKAQTGIPVMLPLFWYSEGFENEYSEYMLGKDMLCAPMLEEGKTGRKVRIPDGEWRDVNGKLYQPGTYRISAPLGTIPVFFREGSDIPDLDKICRLMKGEMR